MTKRTATAAQPLELVPVEQQHSAALVVPASNSPADMMRAFLASGMKAEEIRDLMALQREHDENEARKQFNIAFAQFKAEAVRVYKGTEIKDGPLKGKRHANLFDVVVASAAPLAKYGLSTSWKLTKDEPALMEVTCVLKHAAGHSESVSMSAAPDTGPGRNAIQARGSAKSYLERYTLMAILGLAATDQDDDGHSADLDEERAKSEAKAREWIDTIDAADNLDALKKAKADMLLAYVTAQNVPPQVTRAYNARLASIKPANAA